VRTRGAAELRTLLARYLASLRVRRYSAASIEKAALEVGRLIEHLKARGVHRAPTVREAHLLAYLAKRRRTTNTHTGQPLSPWTQSSTVTVIRRFFSFAEERGVILRSPAAAIALPRARALPRGILSEAQARRLMAAPSSGWAIGKRDRAILEMLYGSGLRRAEVVHCDVSDLDLARGLLLVRGGKGRKDRVVPVPGRALLALGAYLVDARPEIEKQTVPALFLSRHGRRLGVQSVNLLVRRHARTARVRATPHTLRHTCATHLLRGGADTRYVQRLLGHEHITTTALYTRVTIADLREVFGRSHPRRSSEPIRGVRLASLWRDNPACSSLPPRRVGRPPGRGCGGARTPQVLPLIQMETSSARSTALTAGRTSGTVTRNSLASARMVSSRHASATTPSAGELRRWQAG
jgi:integrase/recombinase XerD